MSRRPGFLVRIGELSRGTRSPAEPESREVVRLYRSPCVVLKRVVVGRAGSLPAPLGLTGSLSLLWVLVAVAMGGRGGCFGGRGAAPAGAWLCPPAAEGGREPRLRRREQRRLVWDGRFARCCGRIPLLVNYE